MPLQPLSSGSGSGMALLPRARARARARSEGCSAASYLPSLSVRSVLVRSTKKERRKAFLSLFCESGGIIGGDFVVVADPVLLDKRFSRHLPPEIAKFIGIL